MSAQTASPRAEWLTGAGTRRYSEGTRALMLSWKNSSSRRRTGSRSSSSKDALPLLSRHWVSSAPPRLMEEEREGAGKQRRKWCCRRTGWAARLSLEPPVCRPFLHAPWLPRWFSGKESTCHAGDAGSIPGSRRSPGEGNGNPLQDSCLGNPMERGAWHVCNSPWGCKRVRHYLVTSTTTTGSLLMKA